MPLALAAADLLVGRAGSSTLAEAAALGLPMVVVPYPHAGGHQRANARSLERAGAARVVDDADFDGVSALFEHAEFHLEGANGQRGAQVGDVSDAGAAPDVAGFPADVGFAPAPDAQPLPLGTSDRKSTRLNSSHVALSRMPSSA